MSVKRWAALSAMTSIASAVNPRSPTARRHVACSFFGGYMLSAFEPSALLSALQDRRIIELEMRNTELAPRPHRKCSVL